MATDLFDWNARETWLAEVQDYAASFLTTRVQAKIAKSRPECWSDDFAWLPVSDGEGKFAAAFADFYRHIHAYHGCRPSNVQSYFAHGLRGQTPETIEAQFLEIFRDVPEPALRRALSEHNDRKANEQGKYWVVLDKNDLIENCGHYLIQGSEYLMALAARLCRHMPGEDYRLRLRTIGVPTIFELHIPTEELPELQVAALSRLVLSAWGECIARRPLGLKHWPCLTGRQTIGPQHIVGHLHPRRIIDPHFRHSDYLNQFTKCPRCAD